MRWSITSLLVWSFVMVAGACRTRPYDGDTGNSPTSLGDGQISSGLDSSGPQDGAILPDFSSLRDLTVFPDFLPPPDLTPPHYCDGIYVFEEDNRLSFFDPKTLTFHDIAVLNCPIRMRNDSPFSMAVAKDGTAWVEYQSGELFNVDTTTGHCTATMFVPNQPGFANFGMGFAADGPGSPNETLYLAGTTSPMLGSLDLQTLRISTIGPLSGNGELTGTGQGELWGFFADQVPHLGRIDKQTAQLNPDFPLPQLGDVTNDAFAFGFFGGVFYLFLSPQNGTTTVYRFDPASGMTANVLPNTGRIVVGAGVSTCAPQQ